MGLFSRKNKQERVAEDSGRFYSKDDDAAIGAAARAKRASNAGGGASRKPGNDPMLPEKKRARRRLVGAVALALAAAVGLPMLLDSEPKPLAGDIAIQIPLKDKAAALPVPAADKPVALEDSVDKGEEIVPAGSTAASATATTTAKAGAAKPAAAPKSDADAKPDPEDVAQDARMAERERADRERAARAERADRAADRAARLEQDARLDRIAKAKADDKLQAAEKARADAKQKHDDKLKAADKPAKSHDDAARALALLEGKPADKVKAPETASQRYVLQVIATSSADKAAELQAKMRDAGIASYTEKSASGGLIRVRIGPFSRDEAEKVRAKLGRIGMSGAMTPI